MVFDVRPRQNCVKGVDITFTVCFDSFAKVRC